MECNFGLKEDDFGVFPKFQKFLWKVLKMHCVDELCLFIWHGEISITSSKQSFQCLCWPPSSCGPGRCPEMEKEKKLTEEKYPANIGQYWRRLW